jgi:hypothetical protein
MDRLRGTRRERPGDRHGHRPPRTGPLRRPARCLLGTEAALPHRLGGSRQQEPVDWAAAEDALGTRLPGDYKETVGLLGAGSFDWYVDVLAPDTTSQGLKEWTATCRRLDFYRPCPAFPAPGGLLHWGCSEQEIDFVWVTGAADPGDWTVMTREVGEEWEQHPYGFGEFMVRVLTDTELGWPPSRLSAHTFT